MGCHEVRRDDGLGLKMSWQVIDDGGSGFGIGIRVVLKNGKSEEFMNFGGKKIIAQQSNWNNDVSVGFYDYGNGGEWRQTAYFPANSYQYVLTILGEKVDTSMKVTKVKSKRTRCASNHPVAVDELETHNLEIHDLVECDQCDYECTGTLMLAHHVKLEH